jgi:hypothetical protein
MPPAGRESPVRVPDSPSEVSKPQLSEAAAWGEIKRHHQNGGRRTRRFHYLTALGSAQVDRPLRNSTPMAATDSDPVALQHFELAPEPVPAEVLCGESLEVWALRLSGGPVRDVLATDPVNVATKEYVFAVPLDVMGRLARKLTEVYERQRGGTP